MSKTFALSDDELGETSVVEHSIDTKGPVSTNPHQILYSLRIELEKELENLQRIGCIEKSNRLSTYIGTSITAVRKKGGLRVCIDYRALNKDNRGSDKYPIPRINELIDQAGKCNILSA